MKKITFIALFFALLSVLSGFAPAPASARTAEAQKLPVLMYHHITASKSKQNPYTVMDYEFESDIAYLKEQGYTFIVMRDVIDYVEKGKPFPVQPILVTFDDGYLSFHRYAYPVLKKYDAKAVLSIIGYWADEYTRTKDNNIHYAHMTWDLIEEVSQSGHVDIQNHTYNMHRKKPRKGATRMQGETVECYKQNLTSDISELQRRLKEKCNIVPTTFTYPFGFKSESTDGCVKALGFRATLGCYEIVSTLRVGDASSLFNIGRFNRAGGADFKKLMNKIERQVN